MRLINADALKDSIKKNCGVYFDGTYDNRRICALIDNIPTVYPKQGEWKLDSLGAYCSECGSHPDYSSNFCPNCGADMQKGDAEND